jgi:hypothetical protein
MFAERIAVVGTVCVKLEMIGELSGASRKHAHRTKSSDERFGFVGADPSRSLKNQCIEPLTQMIGSRKNEARLSTWIKFAPLLGSVLQYAGISQGSAAHSTVCAKRNVLRVQDRSRSRA